MSSASKISTLTETFWGWLMGHDTSASQMASIERTIEVRRRILKTLAQAGIGENTRLVYRVTNAPDLGALWFLRPDIMQALSSQHGEVRARRVMQRITPMFKGLLPSSLFAPVRFAV